MSISAHKIYAPKGVGALFVRRGTRLHQQNLGGRQERAFRGGTESVPLIVAFGKAAELAEERLKEDRATIGETSGCARGSVFERIDDAVLNGDREHGFRTFRIFL
jgi:cysteine desulfurase